jgi:hypothetical protein
VISSSFRRCLKCDGRGRYHYGHFPQFFANIGSASRGFRTAGLSRCGC